MEYDNIWFTIICSLVSGLVGSLITMAITLYFQRQKDKRDYKMELFRSLMSSRNDLIDGHTSTGEFEKAINQVFIAFCDCKKVIDAFEDFRKVSETPSSGKTGELVTLLKAMANELNIEYQYANDDLFMKPLQISK